MPEPTSPLSSMASASPYSLGSAAVHMALALLLILLFIFAAYWLLRRLGPKFGLGPAGRGGMLRLISHLSLGPRKSIIVVRFLNEGKTSKDMVLGVTDHTITFLTEVASDHDAAADFATTLAEKAGRPGGPGSAA